MNLRERYAKWREEVRKGNELVEMSVKALRTEAKKLDYWSGHFPQTGVSGFLGVLVLEWLFMGFVFGYLASELSFGIFLFAGSFVLMVMLLVYEGFYSGKSRKLNENIPEKAN